MNENQDILIKSIEIIQGIILRMSRNSFQLKAWFLVVFSALFTFFAKSETKVIQDLVWLLPLLAFVYLDGYYLKQERMFRSIHTDFEKVINKQTITIKRDPFNFIPTKEQLKEHSILNCVFSISIGWFYFPLLIAFQGLIIFHTSGDKLCRYGYMLVVPLFIIIFALYFKKETTHAKG
ncbi:MAG: hypothetical protein ACI86H_002291 [bacterium]|jgi:hypothetical protein